VAADATWARPLGGGVRSGDSSGVYKQATNRRSRPFNAAAAVSPFANQQQQQQCIDY